MRDILKGARFVWGVTGVTGVTGILATLQLSQRCLPRALLKGYPLHTCDRIKSHHLPGHRIGIPPGLRSGRL